MMIEGKMGVYSGPLYVQIHGKYKDKTKQKPPEVEEAREGKPHNRGKWLHHGRGVHHGLTVAATTGSGGHHGLAVVPTVVAARFFPRAPHFGLVWCFALGRGFCLFLGLLGLFASFF